uniref:Uncharacterized protein n=1 Tax=Arion vulgaris TaxID=1028688 RepID=A0A0B7B1W8_9EUPU
MSHKQQTIIFKIWNKKTDWDVISAENFKLSSETTEGIIRTESALMVFPYDQSDSDIMLQYNYVDVVLLSEDVMFAKSNQ